MARRRVELHVDDIFISHSKLEWIARRGVSGEHVVQCLRNEPHFFLLTDEDGDMRHNMLGPVNSGRFLLVAIAELESPLWRLITAHWLDNRRGQKLYEQG